MKKKSKAPALQKCPQKKGSIKKIFTKNPKKPNSALRRVAKIILSTFKIITAYIPGIGHNLQQYHNVLVRGGRLQDVPGIKYKLIRNKYDLLGVLNRKSSRSKYGIKKKKY